MKQGAIMNKNENFATELIKTTKEANKRLFILCVLLIISLVGSVIYTIYLLNDLTVVETTDTQNIEDVITIENSNILNGNK